MLALNKNDWRESDDCNLNLYTQVFKIRVTWSERVDLITWLMQFSYFKRTATANVSTNQGNYFLISSKWKFKLTSLENILEIHWGKDI